jgi:hypothetical protein
MLPNEQFALACRAWYEEQGLVVDETNGEFAHCPQPERYGDAGYYLLHEHHQQQGLLQSRDVGECCFFLGHAKKWLESLTYFPDNFFELWEVYDEYSKKQAGEAGKTAHAEKTEEGKSKHAIKGAKASHAEKDENGKSKHAVEMAKKANEIIQSIKDENGKCLYSVVNAGIMNSQVWVSTIDGFRSNAGNVAQHNRRNGWDPKAKVKVSKGFTDL